MMKKLCFFAEQRNSIKNLLIDSLSLTTLLLLLLTPQKSADMDLVQLLAKSNDVQACIFAISIPLN